MERRPSSSTLAAALVLVTAGRVLAQDPQPIGEHGARVQLTNSWKRSRFAPDLGNEQLVGVKSRGLLGSVTAYAMMSERLGLFECERDYRQLFDDMEDLPVDVPITVEEDGSRRRVSKVVDHTINGSKWTFRSELLLIDGYAMHVMCWVLQSHRDKLKAMVDELVDGIRLPDGDAAAGGSKPKRQTIERGVVEMSFEVRPFVLRPFAPEDAIAGWHTVDEQQGVVVHEFVDVPNAGDAVDREMGILKAHDATCREVVRTPRRIAGFDCLEVRAVAGSYSYRVLMVPSGQGRFVALRHWAPGSVDEVRPDREAIFASLQLRPGSAATLPPVPPEVFVEPAPPEAQRELFAAARRVHARRGWVRRWLSGPNGVWFAAAHDGVFRCAADEDPRLFFAPEARVDSVAFWGDSLFGIDGEQLKQCAADGTATAAPFAAERLAAVGDGLLCVRQRRPTNAFVGVVPAHRQDLWLRRRDGSERLVATVDGWLSDVVADREADRLLVAMTTSNEGAETCEIDLGTGAKGATTSWEWPPELAPAHQGWLATGVPKGRAGGVWHVLPGGELRLLVEGEDVRGVRLDEQELWFSRQRGGEGELACVSLAVAARAIAGFRFVPADGLRALGDDLLQKVATAPRNREEVLATLAALQELAKQRFGAPLATSVQAVDRFLATAHNAGTVGPSGRIVLSLLLATCALEHGAEWVPSERPSWLEWVVAVRPLRDNPFAIVHHVPSAIVAALDDSEADVQQAGPFAAGDDGVRRLCGVDAQALRTAAEAAVPAEFRAASASTSGQMTALVRRWPQNQALRGHAYEVLSAANAWRELADLAGEAVTAKVAGAEHVVVWLSARDRLVDGGAADATLEADVLAALTAHGRDARLWMLLGVCSERRSPPGVARARACYERVLELQRYGELVTFAKSALQRLEAK